jgi:hypothetical protein
LPITLDEILAMRLQDVSDSGSMVSVAGQWFGIPKAARALIRAQLIDLRRHGAAPGDALFVRPRSGQRSHRWLIGAASPAAAEVGARFLDDELRERPTADERWLAERGITLAWIARNDRRNQRLSATELGRVAEELRQAMRRSAATDDCECASRPHRAPADFPSWPPLPRRAHIAFDTGHRKHLFGPRRARYAATRD